MDIPSSFVPTTAAEQTVPPEPVVISGNPLSSATTTTVSSSATAPSDAMPTDSNAVLRTSSFDPNSAGGGGGKRPPTISDIELIFNLIKIVLYFVSVVACALPALSDAAAFPIDDDEELDESDKPYQIVHKDGVAGGGTVPQRHAIVPGAGDSHLGTHQPVARKISSSSSAIVSRWQSFKNRVNTFKRATLHTLRISLALAATVICTYTTWTHIIQFLMDDMSRFANVRRWVVKSDFFTTAYLKVSETPAQYFWSSQLLFFVVPFVLWLVVEHARSPTRQRFFPLCNVWLGCAAAISAAFPLALSAVSASVESRPDRCARHSVPFRWVIVLPLVAAFGCVILLPLNLPPQSEDEHQRYYASTTAQGSSSAFATILAVLHLGVIIPPIVAQFFPGYVSSESQRAVVSAEDKEKQQHIILVPHNIRDSAQREWLSRTASSLWIPISFCGFALSCAIMHLAHLAAVVHTVEGDALFATLVSAFCANECQCSISLDVAQCSLLVVVFVWSTGMLPRLSWAERALLTACVPVLGLGFVFSAAVAVDELRVFFDRMTSGFAVRFLGPSPAQGARFIPPPPVKSAAGNKQLQISPPSSPTFTLNGSVDDLDKTFTLKPGPSAAKGEEQQQQQQQQKSTTKTSSSSSSTGTKNKKSSPTSNSSSSRRLSGSALLTSSDSESEETYEEDSPKRRTSSKRQQQQQQRPIASASPRRDKEEKMKKSRKKRKPVTDSEESDDDCSDDVNVDRDDMDDRSSGMSGCYSECSTDSSEERWRRKNSNKKQKKSSVKK